MEALAVMEAQAMVRLTIDGVVREARPDERLVDAITRHGASIPHVCYHPQLGPIQTCDTCMVDVNGQLARLEGYKSLQWPVAADGTDEPLLCTKRFAFPDGKAKLFPVPWVGPTDEPNAEFDLHLNNGRLLEHFHEGNLRLSRTRHAGSCGLSGSR